MENMQIPRGSAQLIQEFGLWLIKATQLSGRRIVLLIDGLDKLEDYDNALVIQLFILNFVSLSIFF